MPLRPFIDALALPCHEDICSSRCPLASSVNRSGRSPQDGCFCSFPPPLLSRETAPDPHAHLSALPANRWSITLLITASPISCLPDKQINDLLHNSSDKGSVPYTLRTYECTQIRCICQDVYTSCRKKQA